RNGTRSLSQQFKEIIQANRQLLQNSPLTEQQRKAVRDCMFQLDRGIARLRAYSGPYLQQFVDQVSFAKHSALEDVFEEPDIPEPVLPDDFPVVGDRLQLDDNEVGVAVSGGHIDLGYGQRGHVVGMPLREEIRRGVVISDYDIDTRVWRLSS